MKVLKQQIIINMSARKRQIQPTVRELLSPQKSQSRRRLEAEFYQDHIIDHSPIQRNNLQIADQLFNQIIKQSADKRSNNTPIQHPQQSLDQYKHQQKRQALKSDLNHNKKTTQDTNELNKRNIQQPQLELSPFRGNQIRRQQKFLNSQKTSVKQNKSYVQMDRSNQNKNLESPFGKQSLFLEQKRFEMERQYLEALKRQIQQKRAAKMQSQSNKMQIPKISVLQLQKSKRKDQNSVYSPRARGKNDPNGKPPIFAHYIGESDIMYIKNKTEQLRRKLNKGRIDNNQYNLQIRNIQAFYGKPLKELLPTTYQQNSKQVLKPNKQALRQIQQMQQKNQVTPEKNNSVKSVTDLANIHTVKYNAKQSPAQETFKQKRMDKLQQGTNQQISIVQKFGAMQLEMMSRMLRQMRDLYKGSFEKNDKNFIENTLTRYSMQMFPRNQHHKQQDMRNFIQRNNIQSEHEQSLIKAKRQIQKPIFQASELSLREIQQFYEKPYKVKPLSNFRYLQDAHQPQGQLATSQQMERRDRKQLNANFQSDLRVYKILVKQQEAKRLQMLRQIKVGGTPIQFSYPSNLAIRAVAKNSQGQQSKSEYIKKDIEVSPTAKLYGDSHAAIDISQANQIKYKSMSHRKLKKKNKQPIIQKQSDGKQFYDSYNPIQQQLEYEKSNNETPPNNFGQQIPNNSRVKDKLDRFHQQNNSQLRNSSRVSSRSKQKRKKESQIKINFKQLRSDIRQYKDQTDDRQIQLNKPVIVSPKVNKKHSKVHQGSSIKSIQQSKQIIHQRNSDSNSHYYAEKSCLNDKLIHAEEYVKGFSKGQSLGGSQRKYYKKERETYQQSQRNIIRILDQLAQSTEKNQ